MTPFSRNLKAFTSNRAALLLVTGASLVAAWLVFRNLIRAGGQLGWDESAHALYGLIIGDDLRRHDWVSLLYDTYRQVYWPPLNSWLLGFISLFAAPSDSNARVASAACLVLLPPLVYLAASRLSPRHGITAGLLAAGLTLTSPAVLTFSSLCMLEMPGLVAVTLTLFFCIHLTTSGASARWHMLVGLGIAAAFFAKTNYGVLVGLALVATEVSGSRDGFRNLFTKKYFYTGLPVVVAMALWFAYPAKVAQTWGALANQPWGTTNTFGVEGLLFYPRAFVALSGSAWLAAVYTACLLAGLWRWRDFRVRLLVVLVALQFLIGELHHTKVPRNLLPAYPALFLLAGLCGASIWHWALGPRARAGRWTSRLAVLAVIVHSSQMPWRVSPPQTFEIDRDLVHEIATVLRPPGDNLALISWDFSCPPCLDWLLVTREAAMAPVQASYVCQKGQASQLADALRRGRVPRGLAALLTPTLIRYTREGNLRTQTVEPPVESDTLVQLSKRDALNRLAILSLATDPVPRTEGLGRPGPFERTSSRFFLAQSRHPLTRIVQTLTYRLDRYSK